MITSDCVQLSPEWFSEHAGIPGASTMDKIITSTGKPSTQRKDLMYKLAAEAMGYNSVGIPYADVYQAIQTGVVNGVNGFPVAAAYTNLGDVLKYWYMTNYSVEVLNYMISGKTWAKIKPADQEIIQAILAKATIDSINNAKALDDHYMDLMEKKGIKVFKYTKEELVPIMQASASTWPKLEENMTKELMDEFRKELAPK